MATPSVFLAMTTLSQCDSTTGWSGTSAIGSSANSAYYRESTACIYQVYGTTNYVYRTVTSVNLSATYIYAWINAKAIFNNTANGGYMILVGDGTNTIAYHVGGTDDMGFRPKSIGDWSCFVLNGATPPTSYTTIAGSEASLSWTAITTVGMGSTGITGSGFVIYDIIRYGTGIEITGGTALDTLEFQDLADHDASQNNNRAYGIIRELEAEGSFGLQGKLTLGRSFGNCYFNDTSKVILWEDRAVEAGAYVFTVSGGSFGTTNVSFGEKSGGIGINGVVFSSEAVPVVIVATNANINAFNIYGSTFISASTIDITQTSEILDSNFINCGEITFDGSVTAERCVFTGCEQIDPSGAEMEDCSIVSSAVTTALILDAPADCVDISNMSFSGNNRAVEITDNSTNTYVFDNWTFSGSTYDVRHSGSGSITIEVINGGDIPTYEVTGGGRVDIEKPVDVTINVQDIDLDDIQNARVLIEAGSGGSAPYEDSVTMTRSGTTATVSHTAHGMSNGNYIVMRGASDELYNGVFTIAGVATNSYTYTMTGTPAASDSGTVSQVMISELTTVGGVATEEWNYSADQPIIGVARKSSSSPYYKSAAISGTITSMGFETTVLLVSDE